MDTLVLDTIGKLYTYGHGVFGRCFDCGSPSALAGCEGEANASGSTMTRMTADS